MFALVKEQKLERVVGKKKSSLYWFGKRTQDWKKVKWMKDEESVLVIFQKNRA